MHASSMLYQVIFTIQGEIIPEYLEAIQQGQFMLDKRNSSLLWQVYIYQLFSDFP